MRIFAKRFSIYDSHYCYHIVCGFFLDCNRKTYKYKQDGSGYIYRHVGMDVVCWNGSDYIMEQHPEEYMIF